MNVNKEQAIWVYHHRPDMLKFMSQKLRNGCSMQALETAYKMVFETLKNAGLDVSQYI